jgi:putative ABC transport system permease protein
VRDVIYAGRILTLERLDGRWEVVRHDDSVAVLVADGRRVAVFRNLSITLQSGLSMILVVGATLLVQSYLRLILQPIGFEGDVVAATAMYPSSLRGIAAQQTLEASSAKLRRLPGVEDAGVADGAVVDGVLQTLVDVRLTAGSEKVDGRLRGVSDNYFAVAGMRLVRGRGFSAAAGTQEIVVNERLAREHWPDGSAVGRVTSAGTIVGVVRDAFEERYDRQPEPTVYQRLTSRLDGSSNLLAGQLSSGVTYVLKMPRLTPAADAGIRRALFDEAPDVAVVELDTLGQKLANTVRDRTFATLILSLFGIAGVTVTLAGLVGIVATVVARRTREIAIRLAIGAQRRDIDRLVTRDVLLAAFAGGAGGLFAGRWLSTWLASFVYGVQAGNWTTALEAGGVLLTVTAAAALIPARRATRVEAAEALRAE